MSNEDSQHARKILESNSKVSNSAAIHTINLNQKLSTFCETWVPKVVGELNGQYVKLVKFEGEYVWHHHADEDEMFLILDGHVDIHVREPADGGGGGGMGDRGAGAILVVERIISLDPGEFCIIPKGVEHKPVAARLSSVMLFEPAGTRNTGSVDHDYTIEARDLERI